MKRIRKYILILLSAIMLFGSTLTVSAAGSEYVCYDTYDAKFKSYYNKSIDYARSQGLPIYPYQFFRTNPRSNDSIRNGISYYTLFLSNRPLYPRTELSLSYWYLFLEYGKYPGESATVVEIRYFTDDIIQYVIKSVNNDTPFSIGSLNLNPPDTVFRSGLVNYDVHVKAKDGLTTPAIFLAKDETGFFRTYSEDNTVPDLPPDPDDPDKPVEPEDPDEANWYIKFLESIDKWSKGAFSGIANALEYVANGVSSLGNFLTAGFNALKAALADFFGQAFDLLNDLRLAILAKIGALYDTLFDLRQQFLDKITPFYEWVRSFSDAYFAFIGDHFGIFGEWAEKLHTIVADGFEHIVDFMLNFPVKAYGFFTEVNDRLTGLIKFFSDNISSPEAIWNLFWDSLIKLPSNVVNTFLENITIPMVTWVSDNFIIPIKDFVLNDVVKPILDFILNDIIKPFQAFLWDKIVLPAFEELKKEVIFLFVPEKGFENDSVKLMEQKLAFIPQLYQFVLNVFSAIANSGKNPPSLTIHLGNGPDKYGGRDVVMDFSWYAPYKPVVDAVLSGFLILCFVWNLYTHLPSVIGGVSSGVSSTSRIERGGK